MKIASSVISQGGTFSLPFGAVAHRGLVYLDTLPGDLYEERKASPTTTISPEMNVFG